MNYSLIFAAAILVFILYRKFAFVGNDNVKNISAEEAHQLIENNKDVIIIDVRSRQEYKSGHIPGSKSIPVNEVASRVNELEKYKDNSVIVHCASGSRSTSAVRVLLKNNFSNIYHMNHGLTGWKYKLK